MPTRRNAIMHHAFHIINSTRSQGATALYLACQSKYIDIIEALSAVPGIDFNIKDMVGEGGIPTAGS